MKQFWLLFLGIGFACQSHKANETAQANAVRDLLIDRSFWKSQPSPEQRTLVNQHKFSITNTSLHTRYRRITVRFDYFDGQFHRLDSSLYTIEKPLDPRSAIRLDSIQTGTANPATKSATVTVVRAESE